MLYNFNFHCGLCQLYLNKGWGEEKKRRVYVYDKQCMLVALTYWLRARRLKFNVCLLLISWVNLGMSFSLFELQVSHLSSGDCNTYHQRLL